jgi:hypothetical protein
MCALMLAVLWFQPWYLIWLISLGALTVGVRQRITLLFTFTGLMTHTATSIAALEGWYYTNPVYEILTVILMVFAVPALYIAVVLAGRTPLGRAVKARVAAWIRIPRRTPIAAETRVQPS